jgi:hypothetical protein
VHRKHAGKIELARQQSERLEKGTHVLHRHIRRIPFHMVKNLDEVDELGLVIARSVAERLNVAPEHKRLVTVDQEVETAGIATTRDEGGGQNLVNVILVTDDENVYRVLEVDTRQLPARKAGGDEAQRQCRFADIAWPGLTGNVSEVDVAGYPLMGE